MKNIFRILFLSFLFVACQQKIKPEDVSKINGYWEIEKVVFDQEFPNGQANKLELNFFLVGKEKFVSSDFELKI